MKITDYDYPLPDKLIAQFPPKVRGQSRLLVLDRQTGELEHRRYANIADYLKSGDVLIVNDTKVIKARLLATDKLGKIHELLLLEQHSKTANHRRMVLYRGKLVINSELTVGESKIVVTKLLGGGEAEISSKMDLLEIAEQHGKVPLPPYMKRQAKPEDEKRYQTVFADKAGSVAAPTASLNFTPELEAKLKAKGVKIARLTLHVGLGTFLPIRSDNVEGHQMHSEYFEIPKQTVELIQEAKQSGQKVTALGTTVARTLEYAADQILTSPAQSTSGEADIFIYPGYEFKVIDQLITNFHAPRSTVLMLAAAFAGWPNLKHAYEEAIEESYAFLSYGDSMFVL